jgi:hypothetical protein
VSLITGCSNNHVKLDQNELNGIKTVAIKEQVFTPVSGMYFNGQAQKTGSLFGIVGALAVISLDSDPDKIKQMMYANNIGVEKMLRDQFIKELQLTNKFTIIESGHADAEFQLSITKYGLSSVPFQSELQPVVAAKGELKSTDGKTLWSYTRNMNNHSDREIPAVLFDDYMANIELLRIGYNSACQIVAKDLVKNLFEE